MKTSDEMRRENLQILIQEAGGIPTLAQIYGSSESNIKIMLNAYKDSKSGTPKGIGHVAARKLEEVMGKPRGWMDHDHGYGSSISTVAAAQDSSNVTTFTPPPHPVVLQITRHIESMSETGHAVLLYEADKIAKQYPRSKANPAS